MLWLKSEDKMSVTKHYPAAPHKVAIYSFRFPLNCEEEARR